MTSTIRPASKDDIPPASRKVLQRIERRLGNGRNFSLTAAHSPSALATLDGLTLAATRTALPGRLRDAIAMRAAQLNGCEYCVAMHTESARGAGLDDGSVLNFRRGISDDPKEQALLSLTTKIVEDRGHHAGFAVQIARRAGASDAEIIEVIQLVTFSTFSNYLNNLARTELDFPVVDLALPGVRTFHNEARDDAQSREQVGWPFV